MSNTVLVTGASSGIGKAIYAACLARGFCVVGVSRRGPDLMMDLSVPTQVNLFLRTMEKRGPVNVLVLNHGVMPFNEVDVWGSVYDTNFYSYWLILYAIATGRRLITEGGSIILNASVAGVIGANDVPFYSAMKAALLNLMLSYVRPLLERGIRINAISPGIFHTALAGDEPLPNEMLQAIPMKREGDPAELVPVVNALIDCQYIVGQNIIVDGGYSLR